MGDVIREVGKRTIGGKRTVTHPPFEAGVLKAKRDIEQGVCPRQLHRDAQDRALMWQGYATECATEMARRGED